MTAERFLRIMNDTFNSACNVVAEYNHLTGENKDVNLEVVEQILALCA
jgi:hypothetical protein